MSWIIFAVIIYVIILILVCIRIVSETIHSNKVLAYLLFCLFIPVVGILFYLAFGINYWRKRKYNKKQKTDAGIMQHLKSNVHQYDEVSVNANDASVQQNIELASMLLKDLGNPLTGNNSVKLLLNGEEKFPEMLKAIAEAKHHIHLEYYIYECDEIGTRIIELLIKKAKEGVEVRFIYDDFGSPTIKKKIEKEMRQAGIEVFPFHKVRFYLLANRINYRNHRKIMVIDGCTAFVGGINVSDKYINNGKKQIYWRDTHIRLDGPGVYYLQYLFFTDWNFCCGGEFIASPVYFPVIEKGNNNSFVQVAASGPDSYEPSVMYAILQAIYLAKEEILITTPYFIPGDSIMDALRIAALSGLKVKLLVPGICDSKLVNAASQSNFSPLLQAGVEIYLYQKGFVHAKTMITDQKLVVVGTANMDYRSFELNFEVNTIIYDAVIARQLRQVFFDDLENSLPVNKDQWLCRPWYTQFPEKLAKLFSPVL
jgi:cardiolipin synthase A/B